MLTVLQIAIGLTFVFLVFSLIVSAANELVLSLFNHRGRCLKWGIAMLLSDPKTQGVAKAFWDHPLVRSVSSTDDGKPSYLGADIFVPALMDMIRTGKLAAPGAAAVAAQDVASYLNAIQSQAVKETLRAVAGEAQELAEFEKRLEVWFNHGMDRVGGWYKRSAHYCILGLGLVFAAGCNVDTLRITNALATDPKLRESVSQAALDYLRQQGALPPSASPAGTATPAPATNAAAPGQAPEEILKNLNAHVQTLGGLSLPLGWDERQKEFVFGNEKKNLPWVMVGWLLTALAGTQGAPFWFDMLNRVVNVRAAGRSPAEKAKGAAKPRADGVDVDTDAVAG